MFQLTIIPFQVTAFIMAAGFVAASIGLSYLIATVLMERFDEPVFPLPYGVTNVCNFEGCENPATRGTKEVIDALKDKDKYFYLSGEEAGIYCGKHRSKSSKRHPMIRILITAAIWVCLIGGLLAVARLGHL